MTEKQLQAQVNRELRQAGWQVYHTLHSLGSDAGYPDITAAHEGQGRLLFAELKRRGKRPTPAQARWLETLTLAGAEVWVVTPDNLGTFYASACYGQPVEDHARRPDLEAR
jgi:hypothetical protein